METKVNEQLKQKVLNEINNFISTLETFGKIGAAKFALEIKKQMFHLLK